MTILKTDTQPEGHDDVTFQDQFRDAAGHFTSGVAVIGSQKDQLPFGTTASAVLSLSMEPPMMLVCLNRSSSTHDAIIENGAFSISILNHEQGHLARRFARKSSNKFEGLDIEYLHGLPVIPNAIAAMTCTVESSTVGGTHTVFLGDVTKIHTTDGQPLVYYRGGFGAFRPIDE